MSQANEIQDIDGNSDLFSALFKLVCKRAVEVKLPIEVILCQIIYHSAFELILGQLPCDLIKWVVDAAAAQQSKKEVEEDAEGGAV